MKLKEIHHGFYPFSDKQRSYVKKQLAVYEGLIMSVNPWMVINYLQQKFQNTIKVEKLHDKSNDTVVIFVIISNKTADISTLEKLLVYINTLGWAPSTFLNNDTQKWTKFNQQTITDQFISSNTGIEIQIEAKFDVVEIKKPNILYHATPSSNIPKVNKIGLTPKSTSNILSYPERIYLAKDLRNLVDILVPHMAEVKKVDKWAVYEVRNINNIYPALRLFKDPLYPYGYYTLQNIAPPHLKLIHQVDFDNKK